MNTVPKIFIFIAVVLPMLFSCGAGRSNLTLIEARTLEKFPSGSTLAYFDDKLYVAGDDASEILILDSNFREVKRIPLFSGRSGARLAKPTKADVESSTVIKINGRYSIWFFGSGSVSPHRDSVFALNPDDNGISRIQFDRFYRELHVQLNEPNIEAAAMVGNQLLLGARGNTAFPTNYLLLANPTTGTILKKLAIRLPISNLGISGLEYDAKRDRLLITLSSEATGSSYADGKIGNSYLACIDRAAVLLRNEELKISRLVDLSRLGPELERQKVEGIAYLEYRRELVLVSDDDRGGTKLFRIRVE